VIKLPTISRVFKAEKSHSGFGGWGDAEVVPDAAEGDAVHWRSIKLKPSRSIVREITRERFRPKQANDIPG
jgi:hypothetical protein